MPKLAFLTNDRQPARSRELAEQIAAQCEGLGISIRFVDSATPQLATDEVAVAVSPRSFLPTQVVDTESRFPWAKTIFITTAPPESNDLKADREWAQLAGGRFASDYRSSQEWSFSGLHTHHLPPGYCPEFDLVGEAQILTVDELAGRPITFVMLEGENNAVQQPRSSTAKKSFFGRSKALATDVAETTDDQRQPSLIRQLQSLGSVVPAEQDRASRLKQLTQAQFAVLTNSPRSDLFDSFAAIEAIQAGAVVISPPGRDISPLKPNQHIAIADSSRIAFAAESLIVDRALANQIRTAAYCLLTDAPAFASSVGFVVGEAWELVARDWVNTARAARVKPGELEFKFALITLGVQTQVARP